MQNDFIDVSTLRKVFRDGKRTIYISSAVGFLLAAGFSLAMPNVYTATSSSITPKIAQSSLSILSDQLSSLNMGGSAFKAPGDMYIGILRSKLIARKMVARFHLLQVYHRKKESDAENALAGQSVFDSGEKDNIIRIHVTNKDPRLACDMANAYLEELREANGRLALTEAAQRRLFFEQQMTEERKALDNADAALKQTQEHTGFVAPAPQTSLQIQGIALLRENIAAREVQLSGVLQGATDQDPTVIRLRSELSRLRGELSTMIKGQSSDSTGISATNVPEAELEVERKRRDVTYHETLFGLLSKQYEGARLDESHDAPVLQVLDEATIPDTKSGPKRSLISLGGLLLGAFGSMTWLLVRRFSSSVQVTP